MRGGACAVLMFLLVGAKALELNLEEGLTDAKYGAFIAQLRKSLLGRSEDVVWTLPVLRSRGGVPLSERFVLVDITNYAGETVSLALDVTNVYIVGYRVGNRSFFTALDSDDENTRDAIAHLFEGTERHTLPFTGNYPDLERAAGVEDRMELPLGTGALDAAVTTMNLYADRPTPTILHSVARGLIVFIQMISEAARFRYIEFEMKSRIRRNVDSAPDPSVTSLENAWSSLSEQIQMSYADGVFQRSVQLQRRHYAQFHVSAVQVVLPLISLLHFSCQTTSSSSKQQLHHHHHPAVVPAAAAAATRTKLVTSADPFCPAHVQSTWQIMGAHGLCVDVKDGHYDNGNSVQLWPCSSNDDQINQLWTFSSDGTLRSNGKCMASYADAPGDIMIFDCLPAGTGAFTYLGPNGTIASPSGLVLSARSSASGTVLSARENAYTTGQSWLPVPAGMMATSSYPPVQQIAGLSGLYCLHADGDDDVVLGDCNMEQGAWWALYPDSSIRPHQARQLCLAPPDDTQADQPLKTVSCNPNSSLQRWLFRNDGTIVNLSTDLVMDVKGSAMSGARLTLEARAAGTATQEWQAQL